MSAQGAEDVADDWHGWSIGETAIHVGPLPGRKSVCLYVMEGTVLRTLAFFKSKAEADAALKLLDLLAMTGRKILLEPAQRDGQVAP